MSSVALPSSSGATHCCETVCCLSHSSRCSTYMLGWVEWGRGSSTTFTSGLCHVHGDDELLKSVPSSGFSPTKGMMGFHVLQLPMSPWFFLNLLLSRWVLTCTSCSVGHVFAE
ncbi:unnamed protein product, partial [Musa acuminata subsp. burmannicoides]